MLCDYVTRGCGDHSPLTTAALCCLPGGRKGWTYEAKFLMVGRISFENKFVPERFFRSTDLILTLGSSRNLCSSRGSTYRGRAKELQRPTGLTPAGTTTAELLQVTVCIRAALQPLRACARKRNLNTC